MRLLSYVIRVTAFAFVLSCLMWRLAPSITLFSEKEPYSVLYDFPLPESLTLCEEVVPLEDRRVWEMLDREFTISVWDRAQVFMWLKRAGRYFPYIEKRLAEEEMPEDLKYLAVAESSLITHSRSRNGAIGLWQFMTRTAKSNGLRKNRAIDERRSFELSTEAALKNLKRLKDMFGTWSLALAAYNCGATRLKKEIKQQKTRDYYRLDLPMETERFVFRIAAIKIIMENPKRYGYNLAPDRTYRPLGYDTVPVKIRVPLAMTEVAHALDTDFKFLKELNPHILGPYLPTGRYTINVPAGQGAGTEDILKELTRIASRRMKKASDGYYVVQPGDTLGHIARRKGVSVATLRRLNAIQGSFIMVGQKLRLNP